MLYCDILGVRLLKHIRTVTYESMINWLWLFKCKISVGLGIFICYPSILLLSECLMISNERNSELQNLVCCPFMLQCWIIFAPSSSNCDMHVMLPSIAYQRPQSYCQQSDFVFCVSVFRGMHHDLCCICPEPVCRPHLMHISSGSIFKERLRCTKCTSVALYMHYAASKRVLQSIMDKD